MRVRGVLVVAAMVGALLPAAGPALAATTEAATTEACPDNVPRAGFRDVAATNVHADSVNCAVWWEMARGSSRTRFRPGASVSRGQMATFVAKMILRSGGRLPASPGDLFPDDEQSPHHYSINRLAKVGIVAGSDGKYRPDALVTRAQMATFLVRAYEYRTGERLAADRDAFRDDTGSPHERNINRAAAAGFTSGVARSAYAPADDVLRAQMATFVTRTLDGVADTGQVDTTPTMLRSASALESFDECDPLLGHLKERGLEEVGPYGWNQWFMVEEDTAGGEAPASEGDDSGGGGSRAGVDYSETNNQEAGVDEADLVKTDGRIIVSVVGERLRVLDVTGAEPQLVGSLPLGPGSGSELLLRGTRALVLSTDYGWEDMPRPVDDTIGIAPEPGSNRGPTARLTLVDLSDPAAPRVESVLEVDGSMVAARMVQGIARIVVRSEAPQLAFEYPADGTQQAQRDAAEHNRLVVERSAISDWLPTYRQRNASGATVAEGAIMGCTDLRRPPEYSGLGSINVLTVDLAGALQPGEATGVLAGGEIVYASPQSLYVATTKWGPWTREPLVATPTTTEVHKFAITDPSTARYEASGKVPGFMLNQFSMSELDGNLRTATTSRPSWWAEPDSAEQSQSQVVILQQSGETLSTIGQVGGLGRGEQIFAVRFIGNQGYVVTFRQTDPLYTLDLSDPAAPRVTGELKIMGYSAYLHPVGEGLLLGVGQDADAEGATRGTQLSLFDVSDPAAPTRIAQATLAEGTYSDVEFDHRAFLHWPATGTTVLPISRYTYDEATQTEDYFVGAAGFDVGTDAISHIADISHGSPDMEGSENEAWPGIRRSLVIGGIVYTVSERGLMGSEMETLTRDSWTSFDR